MACSVFHFLGIFRFGAYFKILPVWRVQCTNHNLNLPACLHMLAKTFLKGNVREVVQVRTPDINVPYADLRTYKNST